MIKMIIKLFFFSLKGTYLYLNQRKKETKRTHKENASADLTLTLLFFSSYLSKP